MYGSGSEIDHEDVIENGFEDGHECLVVGVGEIDFTGLGVFEGHDEAMSEFLVQPFGAIVLSPLQGENSVNLILEGGEGLFHFLDLFRFGFLFEFEAHDVSDRFRGIVCMG